MKNHIAFVNGRIYTMDPANHVQEALEVRDGKICRTGSSSELLADLPAGTEVVDLEGRTVLPGLCDCHAHLIMLFQDDAYDIHAAGKSKEELLAEVADLAKKRAPGEWITGMGWDQHLWGQTTYPTKEELDAVAQDHPVKLTRYCGNAHWCSSRALEAAGLISDAKSGSAGSEFLVNEKGELLGTVVGAACRKIDAAIPPFSEERHKQFILNAQERLLRAGITTAMDKGAGTSSALSTDCGRAVIRRLEDLYESGALKVRFHESIICNDEFLDDCFRDGPQLGLYDGRLTIRSMKIWTDGAFGPKTAWLTQSYADEADHRGNQKYQNEELIAYFKKADELGVQVAIHTIGDASSAQILDCFEAAYAGSLDRDRRFTIEHFHVPRPEDITRLCKYPIINSTQFIQFSSDMNMVHGLLPEDMIPRLYPWRQVLDGGAVIVNGSDMDPLDPFKAMHVAVNRESLEGVNVMDPTPEAREHNKLTRMEALESYTTKAAYSRFEEDISGSLEAGKYADFIVIDRDYFTCPAREIKDIQVLRTVLGGETLYEGETT